MNDNPNTTPTGFGVTQDIGPWQVLMQWAPGGVEGAGPRYLTIRPAEGATDADLAAGLSSTVLRQVDFQAALAKWRTFTAGDDTRVSEFQKHLQPYVESFTSVLRATLAEGVTDRYLAWLSAAYVTIVKAGEKSVNENLGQLIGRNAGTARSHLTKARALNLLTKMEGKAGGDLTEKAQLIIENHINEMSTTPDG
ncbi:hypothetical protein ACFQ1S_03125 [Kibdelosporangium lantanae]|uniref:Uncharacterized protein n=1 Tax=Kibdelosporangium lantanae TaxID=1497396 RepID=A0ABW3M1T8_9PSEU